MSSSPVLTDKVGDALRSIFTRRNLIAWWLAGLMTAIGAMTISPILAYLWPTGGAQVTTKIKVLIGSSLSKLEDDAMCPCASTRRPAWPSPC